MGHRRLSSLIVVGLCALGSAVAVAPAGALAGEGCANEALREAQASTFLADCRAYEMVSPPEKNGADVLLTTERTRVAENGDAFGFASLAGFAEAQGVEVASDYISERTGATDTQGWATHGITPVQLSLSLRDVLSGQEPLYAGLFSRDLNAGVFFAVSPLTNDPMVAGVANLYRRSDLLSSGAGAYELLTACPLCEATKEPLPPISGEGSAASIAINGQRPVLAGSSPDLGHVVFESPLNLTADAPAQPAFCNLKAFPFSLTCGKRLYEWDRGTVRLAGILPENRGAADASFSGQGAHNGFLIPGVVSDGSDGHSRVFFTQPTNQAGETLSQQQGLFGAAAVNASRGGNLFVRVDHAVTVQLNVSERKTADAFAPAEFLDASKEGTRAFFMTTQALTEDAPADGNKKIYMYDATRPAGEKLTLIDPDEEPEDNAGNAIAEVGVSNDGHYFYFMQGNQLIKGDQPFGDWIYLWHDGRLSLVGPAPPNTTAEYEDFATGIQVALRPRQARVSADGHVLLFSTISGEGLTGYDHGSCNTGIGFGCRELYVYSTDTGKVVCASCNPSGAPAAGMATDFFGINLVGGTRGDPLSNAEPLTADGSKVFFDSPDALVSQDTNGRYDAYEYDVNTGKLSLLSSGTDSADSYFVNADPTGDNAFVVTRQPMVGWDTDGNYDMYDVRTGGGFAEPPPPATPCSADTCQGGYAGAPALLSPASVSFAGAGNVETPGVKSSGSKRRKSARCRRGFVRRRRKGRTRCVRRAAHGSRTAGRHS